MRVKTSCSVSEDVESNEALREALTDEMVPAATPRRRRDLLGGRRRDHAQLVSMVVVPAHGPCPAGDHRQPRAASFGLPEPRGSPRVRSACRSPTTSRIASSRR